MQTNTQPIVYISYRWIDVFDQGRWGRAPDPRARELADRLRATGVDVRLDIYFRDSLHGFRPPQRVADDPRDPWLAWSAQQIAEADAVLLFCTPEYAAADPDRGACPGEWCNWCQLDEATRIGTRVPALWWDWCAIAKQCTERPQKFIPIGIGCYHGDQIPAFVRGASYINLSDHGGFDALLRRIRQVWRDRAPRQGVLISYAHKGLDTLLSHLSWLQREHAKGARNWARESADLVRSYGSYRQGKRMRPICSYFQTAPRSDSLDIGRSKRGFAGCSFFSAVLRRLSQTFMREPCSYRREFQDYAEANAAMVRRAASGQGPDSSKPADGAGARMVVNIASTHVPAFCRDRYKNGYDLGSYAIGVGSGKSVSRRVLVDQALPVPDPRNTYFGAVAISGSGIRFYGDVCLVLKGDFIPDTTVVLDRNSYDLVRQPLAGRIHSDADRKREANNLAGNWANVGDMAAVKTLEAHGPMERRLTTGQIADTVLVDEDYLEVLKEGTFNVRELQEARLSSAEAAADAQAFDRLLAGPGPSLASLTLLNQRRRAERALRAYGIKLNVVTTSGRVR